MSTISIIFKVLYTLVMICYTFYQMIQAIIAYNEFAKLASGFNNLISNWEEDVIIDLQAADSSCPAGYDEAFNLEWPGTISGCNCLDASYSTLKSYKLDNKLYAQTCSTNMTASACIGVQSVSKVPLSRIPPGSGKLLCVKRAKGIDFIESSKHIKLDGTCDSGYMFCGGDAGSEKEKYRMCVKEGGDITECPIAHLEWGTTTTNATLTSDTGLLDGSNKLFWGKASNGLPVSEFRASVSKICYNDNLNPYFGVRKRYPLENPGNWKTQCLTTDETFVELTEKGLQAIYDANNVPYTSLPLYDSDWLNNTITIKYYWRTYRPFTPACKDEVFRMQANDDEVKQMSGAQSGLIAIAIIVAIVLGVIFTLIELYLIFIKNVERCRKSTREVAKIEKCLKCKKCINYTLKCINAIFLLVAVIVSMKVKGFFSRLATLNCSDDANNTLLTDLADKIEKFVYKKNFNALLAFLGMVAVDIAKILWNCFKKKNENESDHKEVGPNNQAKIVPT